jgi:hypothetical protein
VIQLVFGHSTPFYGFATLGVFVLFGLPWLTERWMDVRDRWRSGR